MRLRDKSLEELEEIEQELLDQQEELGHPNYYEKIQLYKEMHHKAQKLVRQKEDGYKSTLEYVKKKLIDHLIRYGTYLKTEYLKDDRLAASCLIEALTIDSTNPIAAYRLGFLCYKEHQYSGAIQYFERALENQKWNKEQKYKLNDQQIVNAHLYLSNSALHIAKQTYENMNQLPVEDWRALPDHDLSPLFQRLLENEQYLLQNAFYNITKNGKSTCSKDECEELTEHPSSNTIILYFGDRLIQLFYEGKYAELSFEQGNMLQHFMLKSSEERPATRSAFAENNNIRPNTYTTNVTRLRRKLLTNGFPPIIHTKRYQEETAYFFDQTYNYHVLSRVDEGLE